MKIDNQVDALFAAKKMFPGRDILFHGVAGSHAMGWATPQSDYDVFGVYVPSLGEHVTLDSPAEAFQKIEGNVDVTLWSLRKFFNLMATSNATALVSARTFGTDVISVIASSCVVPRTLFKHYAGVANSCFSMARNLQHSGEMAAAQKKARYGLYYANCLAYLDYCASFGNYYLIPSLSPRVVVGAIISVNLRADARILVNAGMALLQPVFTLRIDDTAEWSQLVNGILNRSFDQLPEGRHWAARDIPERLEALYKRIVLERAGLLP